MYIQVYSKPVLNWFNLVSKPVPKTATLLFRSKKIMIELEVRKLDQKKCFQFFSMLTKVEQKHLQNLF